MGLLMQEKLEYSEENHPRRMEHDNLTIKNLEKYGLALRKDLFYVTSCKSKENF